MMITHQRFFQNLQASLRSLCYLAIVKTNFLVSAQWLREHVDDPEIISLEVHLKGQSASAFCIEEISDSDSDLPHMLPAPDLFDEKVRRLGVSPQHTIVLFERSGIYAAPRAWFMFRAMGFPNVFLLDEPWFDSGKEYAPPPAFDRPVRAPLFCDLTQVSSALISEAYEVIDARSAGRFLGKESDPRTGVPSGHMPGSINIPYTEVLTNGRFRPLPELRAVFQKQIAQNRNLIFSCGSGVTACITAFAAQLAGLEKIQIYDGSWSEWTRDSSRPISSV